jgi:hypothetical protein
MADPISISSEILALAAFALQSSEALHETVARFRSNQRTLREFKEELKALNGALETLQGMASASNTDVDLTMLRLPLLRCGKACKDIEAVIVESTARSGGSRTDFRDWAKLRYMGDDIVGVTNMLAGYRSTIGIGLADANM